MPARKKKYKKSFFTFLSKGYAGTSVLYLVILTGGLVLGFMLAGGGLPSQSISPIDKAVVTLVPGEEARGQANLQLQSFSGITGIPTPEPPPPGGGSSGEAMPVGDMPGWKQIFAEDFLVDAPLGSWGSDSDSQRIAYTGITGTKWRSYPKSFLDTYQRRPYRADQVLSVKNGMLNFHLHNVDGQPAGANPSPLITGTSQYQTYGKYVARFKTDTPNLREYHIAWLFWPQSERGNCGGDGEEDFPEGSLAEPVGGFHHYAIVGCGQDQANRNNFRYTDWHTYTIEWTPGRIRYLVDTTVVLDSTRSVPSKPMRWQLQTETDGSGTSDGNLTVDWVTVYAYQP